MPAEADQGEDAMDESVATAAPPRNAFDRYFEITARGSTVGREIRGGLATFFTMAYIVVLNPLILGGGRDGDGGQAATGRGRRGDRAGRRRDDDPHGRRRPASRSRWPPGLGVNALVAFEIAPQMTWADAMGLVVIEGVIIAILVLTGLRHGGLPRRADAAEDGDRRRHRPVPGPHRLRRRRASSAATRPASPPIGLGIGGRLVELAGAWSSCVGLLFTHRAGRRAR